MPKMHFNLRIDEDLNYEIMRLANQYDISKNQLIERILTEYVEAHADDSVIEDEEL